MILPILESSKSVCPLRQTENPLDYRFPLRCCSSAGVNSRRLLLRASRRRRRLRARRPSWQTEVSAFNCPCTCAGDAIMKCSPACLAHDYNALRCCELPRVRMTPMDTGSPSISMCHPNVAAWHVDWSPPRGTESHAWPPWAARD